MLDQVLSTLRSREHASLERLKEFLRIPSVSAKPDHANEVRRCAQWVCDQLKFAELEASVMQTRDEHGQPGHPIVVAKNKHQTGRPTVLIYGHYDVQPPEPIELWQSPPFEPSIRVDDRGFEAIFSRGACDDKGQVMCHVEAITAWQAHGGVPINLIVLVEGEEEIGSENLLRFLEYYRDDLRADVCLISDTGMYDRDTPGITSGLRGLLYAELFLTGPSHDLHSGQFGGAAPNPANALCKLIASLHDENGRVNIPGFYDDVEALSQAELAQIAQLEFDEADWMKGIGIDHAPGEAGFDIYQRTTSRPTLDVNGITTGYQGAGAKTVIPSKASAKLSMRLVPHQDPQKIRDAFEQTLHQRLPRGFKLEIEYHGQNAAARTPVDSIHAEKVSAALKDVYGKRPIFFRTGGTIPVVGWIKQTLGCDSLLVGFGLEDDRVHSPNEKFDLSCFHRGTLACAAIYDALGKPTSRTSQD